LVTATVVHEIAPLSDGSPGGAVRAISILGHSHEERGVEFSQGAGDGWGDAEAFLPAKGNFDRSASQFSSGFRVRHIAYSIARKGAKASFVFRPANDIGYIGSHMDITSGPQGHQAKLGDVANF